MFVPFHVDIFYLVPYVLGRASADLSEAPKNLVTPTQNIHFNEHLTSVCADSVL